MQRRFNRDRYYNLWKFICSCWVKNRWKIDQRRGMRKLRDTIFTLRSCICTVIIAARISAVLLMYLVWAIPCSQALFILLWNGQQKREVMFRYRHYLFFFPFEALLIWNCSQLCQFRFERTASDRTFRLWIVIKINSTKMSNIMVLVSCLILFLYLFILV